MTCVFCEIVAGHEPSSVVYEDEHVLAFLDVAPATEHHALVVTKQHAVGLDDLAVDSAAAMMPAAQAVARSIRRFDPTIEGVSLWLADGSAAGQDVFHVHLHVVPRKRGDGVQVDWPYGSPSREELDSAAARLRDV